MVYPARCCFGCIFAFISISISKKVVAIPEKQREIHLVPLQCTVHSAHSTHTHLKIVFIVDVCLCIEYAACEVSLSVVSDDINIPMPFISIQMRIANRQLLFEYPRPSEHICISAFHAQHFHKQTSDFINALIMIYLFELVNGLEQHFSCSNFMYCGEASPLFIVASRMSVER